jgi:hypothetical protein
MPIAMVRLPAFLSASSIAMPITVSRALTTMEVPQSPDHLVRERIATNGIDKTGATPWATRAADR